MKKLLMIAAMIAAAFTAKAQSEAGTVFLKPLVGINVSTITEGNGESKVGLAAGAEFGYQLSDNFALTVGAIYSMQGAKNDEATYNIEYINIPILANAYITKGLAVKVGIQPGFKTKGKINANGISVDDELFDEDMKVKGFDFSIPVGMSYEFSDFVIDARYNWGVSNIIDGFDSKNSVFQFTLGYKFAL